MADRSQDTATNTLRAWGFWTFKAADALKVVYGSRRQLKKPAQPGRADVIAGWNGQLIFVEVKDGKKSFSFARWEDHQRRWAAAVERVCRLPYWLFLVMGTDNPNYNPEKYTPKRAWLLPGRTMLAVERLLMPYQASIPYRAGKGYSKVLQERELDAVHLLHKYELPWGKGRYDLPQTHPFFTAFQPPLKDVRDTWNEFHIGEQHHVSTP